MKLIYVDAAKKAVHEEFDECLVWDESGRHTANVIEEILEALPTVDAVPVVRCKDCGWYDVARYTKEGLPDKRCKLSFCSMWVCFTEPDFYCAYGMREKSYVIVNAEHVRHGKWIPYKAYLSKFKDSWVDEVRCSVCGYAFGEPEWKYCPECGARMDAEMETDQSGRSTTCDYCKHWHGLKRGGRYWCSKHSAYMETGCEEGERKK